MLGAEPHARRADTLGIRLLQPHLPDEDLRVPLVSFPLDPLSTRRAEVDPPHRPVEDANRLQVIAPRPRKACSYGPKASAFSTKLA